MNFSVLASSFILIFEDPLGPPDSIRNETLLGIDFFFTIVFVLEALIKIIALGACVTSLSNKKRKAYFKESWNRLDFFLVIIQIADLLKRFITNSSSQQALI